VIEVVALPADGEETTWQVQREGVTIGTARTRLRRGGLLLLGLDVAPTVGAETLDALLAAWRDQGHDSVVVDVPADDPVLEAAVAGRPLQLQATQMLLDLGEVPAPPARVALRPMTPAEFQGYRDQLITVYAQDMLDAGAFTDRARAFEASVASTEQLLPDGLATPGQHLWTAHDGEALVAILWIAVDGPTAFIYDIEVHHDQRRRGYGREVLDAGARAAHDLGARELGLNVFGHNDGARTLYERAAYATTERTYRLAT
jgi:ribosomal protein S18 acetylase RimI-like enzyme